MIWFGTTFHESNIGDPIEEEVQLEFIHDFTHNNKVCHRVEFSSPKGFRFVWMTEGGVRFEELIRTFKKGDCLLLKARIKDFRKYQVALQTWVGNCRFEELATPLTLDAEVKTPCRPTCL